MSSHEPGRPSAGIPLEAHLEELRRRCEAVARVQGGSTHYLEEIRIFREYAREGGHWYLPGPPEPLTRPPDDEGNEHQVWFQREANTYLKITWSDFFGLLVLHRPDEDGRASPIAYLDRWRLHNELFGDNVKYLGAIEEHGKLRLAIEQGAIEGVPATLQQIDDFFTGHGWKRFTANGEVAFFDPARRVVISDTHRGNLITMQDGLLAPIDLRVQSIDGALLDYVMKACVD